MRPSAPMPTTRWEGECVQDLGKVIEGKRVAVLAPPVPHHPVGQHDEVVGLLASVDDDRSQRGYEYVGADQAGCATALLCELFGQHRPRYLAH
jgi:hypothetical protein